MTVISRAALRVTSPAFHLIKLSYKHSQKPKGLHDNPPQKINKETVREIYHYCTVEYIIKTINLYFLSFMPSFDYRHFKIKIK